MNAVQLDAGSVEAVAQRVAELLQGEPVNTGLVDAAEIGRRFGVSRDYVYEHSAALGAIKLGDGPKARLRFDPEIVAEHLGGTEKPKPPKRATRHRRPSSAAALLPIRGGHQ